MKAEFHGHSSALFSFYVLIILRIINVILLKEFSLPFFSEVIAIIKNIIAIIRLGRLDVTVNVEFKKIKAMTETPVETDTGT